MAPGYMLLIRFMSINQVFRFLGRTVFEPAVIIRGNRCITFDKFYKTVPVLYRIYRFTHV